MPVFSEFKKISCQKINWGIAESSLERTQSPKVFPFIEWIHRYLDLHSKIQVTSDLKRRTV